MSTESRQVQGIGCTDAIRVFMGACWQHAEGEPGQVVTDSWTACDDVECCFARYRVCKVGEEFFSQQITPPSFTGDCTKFVDPACEPWCDKAPKGAPPPETKGVLNGAAEIAAEHIVIQPNPSRDMLAVSVINPVSLTGTIMVTDLRGASVDIEPIIVQDGNITHFELNVSRLAAGTYVYTLTRTNGTSVSGRFVVTR